MKKLLFFSELGRLLKSRLTWLVMLLVAVSPAAGLAWYKPASAETMLSMYLANPALAGGVAGEFIFEAVENAAGSVLGENADALIKIIQNSVLALLLVGVLVYMLLRKEKGVYLPSAAMTIKAFAACCVLGVISTFLGIGGGPINVCVLCLVLRTDTKEVTFYSLLTVMFAQVAKLFKLAVTGGFTSNVILDVNLEWWALVIMIAAAVIGGLLGAVLNKVDVRKDRYYSKYNSKYSYYSSGNTK